MPKHQTPTSALVIGLLLLVISLISLVMSGMMILMVNYMPQETASALQTMNMTADDLPAYSLYSSVFGGVFGLVAGIPLLMGRNFGRLAFNAYAAYNVLMNLISPFINKGLGEKMAANAAQETPGFNWLGLLLNLAITALCVWLLNRHSTKVMLRGYKAKPLDQEPALESVTPGSFELPRDPEKDEERGD